MPYASSAPDVAIDQQTSNRGGTDYTQPDLRKHPRAKPYREQLRADLEAYRAKHSLSMVQLARELDTGSTAVSKYLARKPEGDVERLEARIADAMKAAPKRRDVAAALFATNVTRTIAGGCEIIRKTNDVGLLTGPAGVGKSCGVDLYAAANPTSIPLRLSRWTAHSGGLEAALFAQLETRAKGRSERRSAWMVERLKGSNRLIIVDKANRLTAGALDWLFDFHDETECPVALVANPEILAKVSQTDQRFSRVGYKRNVELKQPASAASALLQQLCPDDADALQELATHVASQRGHLRALRKHIALMPELIAAADGDAATAFRMAHTQLVNDYSLSD